GLGGHRCQAEICTLRHGARAKYVVQDFESEIFAEGWQGGIVREGATPRTCPRLAFVCVSLWSCLEFASGGMQRAYLVVQFAGALATARNSNRSAVAASQFTTSGFDQAPARCGSKGGPLMISKLADRSGTLIVTVRFIAVLLAALVSGRALAATRLFSFRW